MHIECEGAAKCWFIGQRSSCFSVVTTCLLACTVASIVLTGAPATVAAAASAAVTRALVAHSKQTAARVAVAKHRTFNLSASSLHYDNTSNITPIAGKSTVITRPLYFVE